MTSQAFIRALEEISNNALPALYSLHYDGWVLRLSDTLARRANSISPLYPSTLSLDEKIDHCEAVYRERGRRVVFKMTDAAQPPELAETLITRGYAKDSQTSVQTLQLSEFDPRSTPQLPTLTMTVTARPTPEWLADQAALHDAHDRSRLTSPEAYRLLTPEALYFRALLDGGPAASGLGVIERGWIGLYSIVVEERLRGRGVGRWLVGRMLMAGRERGAAQAYLQVMTSNMPALQLYTNLGFREAYRYWYLQR